MNGNCEKSVTDKNRDLIVLLARRCPDLNPYQVCAKVEALRRLAGRWTRATVHWCNGTRDEAWVDKERAAVLRGSVEALEGTALMAYLTGDPRGYVYKLVSRGGDPFPHNTWGGSEEGWGVE